MSDAAQDLRAADAAARALAQRAFDGPLVLEAGAGTGKTATLVARVVAWSLGPGWTRAETALADSAAADASTPDRIASRVLSRVVAITFTEAAAAEMATRVEQALLAVERGEPVVGLDADALPPASVRAPRASALRDALDHLVVQTLHAYARRLLTLFPFEAGLHPNLEVDADGRRQKAIVRRVLERALRTAYAEDGDALALAADGHGPAELETLLLELLNGGIGAEELARDPGSPERMAALLGRLDAALAGFIAAGGDRLRNAKRGQSAQDACRLVDRLRAERERASEPAAALAALRAQLADAEKEIERFAKKWAKGDFTQGEEAVAGDRAAEIAAASAALAPLLSHLAELDLPGLVRATRVLGGLLAEVERELDRQGVATFSSLLTSAAGLLSGRPDVAAAVRREIDQLLVDEFQDTDPRQCAIVAALALEGEDRPGLFLVGDPKQSIYGWRDADLSAYEAFVLRARASGGALHRLSVNMRSLPAVLDEVERVIGPVMTPEPGVQPAFERLVPCDANAGDRFPDHPRFAGVEYWVVAPADVDGDPDARFSAGAATRLEAQALASDLVALHAEGVPFRDVGVLFRSRGDWDVYLTALREANVPFAVEGDRSYYRRREIIDASAWVRCVLDPGDRLALVGALRSTAVGVPDAAWMPLFAMDLPQRVAQLSRPEPDALATLADEIRALAASLPGDVPGLDRIAGWEHNLVAAISAIAALRESFERDPADVFVESLRERVLLEAGEASRFLGPWRVANLERFFRDLTEALADGSDVAGVLRELRHAVAEEEEMEEEPPHDAAADAVQILTLHGAKGLDFEHVYLMQLHKGSGERPGPRLDAARIDGRLELRLLGAPTLGFDRAQTRRRQVAEAEHVRLLYVGMTRAKRRLVVSGGWPTSLRRQGLRHVDLLMERRGLPDEGRIAEALRDRVVSFDAEEVRFVLPALRAEEGARVAPAVADASPGPEPADAPAYAMPELRRLARDRMARPLGGVASHGPARADEQAEARAEQLAGDAPRSAAHEAARDRSAEVARRTGTVVHSLLEQLDLSRPVAESFAEIEAPLRAACAAVDPPALRSAVEKEARGILEGLRGGALLARLEAVRHHVVARELPVLLPARPEDPALGFLAGAIDLVYRDPSDGRLVVADFKTDRAADEAELAEKAAQHAAQGAHYVRALSEALSLAEPPRFEIWFLAADRRVDAARASSNPPHQLSLTLGAET